MTAAGTFVRAVSICSLVAATGTGIAQQYPAKPVRLIVSTSAGSGADVIARLVGNGMTPVMNQQVIIEHRAGAGGNIAAEAVAKSPPDGYTLLVAMVSHAANVSLYRKLGYDLLRDLLPVTEFASSPQVVVVHPSLPAHSVMELVKLARSRPGAIDYASASPGTSSYLAGELFKSLAGVNLVNVPYRGGGEVLTSVLSGETAVSFLPIATALPLARRGALRALAVSSPKRLPLMPDTPTVAEAGIRDYRFGNWYGLMAPAKTPSETIDAIHAAASAALKTPEVNQRLVELGYLVVGDGPAEFGAHIRSEIAAFSKLIRQSGIKVD